MKRAASKISPTAPSSTKPKLSSGPFSFEQLKRKRATYLEEELLETDTEKALKKQIQESEKPDSEDQVCSSSSVSNIRSDKKVVIIGEESKHIPAEGQEHSETQLGFLKYQPNIQEKSEGGSKNPISSDCNEPLSPRRPTLFGFEAQRNLDPKVGTSSSTMMGISVLNKTLTAPFATTPKLPCPYSHRHPLLKLWDCLLKQVEEDEKKIDRQIQESEKPDSEDQVCSSSSVSNIRSDKKVAIIGEESKNIPAVGQENSETQLGFLKYQPNIQEKSERGSKKPISSECNEPLSPRRPTLFGFEVQKNLDPEVGTSSSTMMGISFLNKTLTIPFSTTPELPCPICHRHPIFEVWDIFYEGSSS